MFRPLSDKVQVMVSSMRLSSNFLCGALIFSGNFLNAAPIHESPFHVLAWGDLQYDFQVPDDGRGNGPPIYQIAAGDFHSVALKRDGTVSAWGDDTFGQLDIPQILPQGSVTQIAAGNIHTLALLQDGTVMAWGPVGGQYGDYGQCYVPPGLGPVVAVAAGAVHSLALRADGTVAAWGLDQNGQCEVPAGLSNVVAIAGGMQHSVALKADGTVVAWGESRYGETAVPAGLNNVVAIAAGGFHSLALKRDGTLAFWGKYGLADQPFRWVYLMWLPLQPGIITAWLCAATAPWWPGDLIPTASATFPSVFPTWLRSPGAGAIAWSSCEKKAENQA